MSTPTSFLAAQYQRHRGTFCLRITTSLNLVSVMSLSPLPEICGISIVMYVSELFVDGKCIIGSLVRRTFARGRRLLFYAIVTCRILPQPQIRGFQYVFLDYLH